MQRVKGLGSRDSQRPRGRQGWRLNKLSAKFTPGQDSVGSSKLGSCNGELDHNPVVVSRECGIHLVIRGL